MLFTVYACLLDQLRLRKGQLGSHIFHIAENSDSELHTVSSSMSDEMLNADFIPLSVYRHSLELNTIELHNTSVEYQQSGLIDPNAELSSEPVPLNVTAPYSRKRIDLSAVPIHKPPSKEYYAAKRRMAA